MQSVDCHSLRHAVETLSLVLLSPGSDFGFHLHQTSLFSIDVLELFFSSSCKSTQFLVKDLQSCPATSTLTASTLAATTRTATTTKSPRTPGISSSSSRSTALSTPSRRLFSTTLHLANIAKDHELNLETFTLLVSEAVKTRTGKAMLITVGFVVCIVLLVYPWLMPHLSWLLWGLLKLDPQLVRFMA